MERRERKPRRRASVLKISIRLGIAAVLWYLLWPAFIPLMDSFRDKSLPHVLKTADEVMVSGAVSAKMDQNTHPEMLALLKTSSQFHSSEPSLPCDMRLSVPVYEGRHWIEIVEPEFQYCSQTGELGSDHEWCIVPAPFKAWMLQQKAPGPMPKANHTTSSYHFY